MAKGEVKAVVTSAKPLPKKEMDELMQTLKGMLAPGQTSIQLETKVNPGLVNGVTIELGGDKFMDLSVASRLKKLQTLLGGGLGLALDSDVPVDYLRGAGGHPSAPPDPPAPPSVTLNLSGSIISYSEMKAGEDKAVADEKAAKAAATPAQIS